MKTPHSKILACKIDLADLSRIHAVKLKTLAVNRENAVSKT